MTGEIYISLFTILFLSSIGILEVVWHTYIWVFLIYLGHLGHPLKWMLMRYSTAVKDHVVDDERQFKYICVHIIQSFHITGCTKRSRTGNTFICWWRPRLGENFGQSWGTGVIFLWELLVSFQIYQILRDLGSFRCYLC